MATKSKYLIIIISLILLLLLEVGLVLWSMAQPVTTNELLIDNQQTKAQQVIEGKLATHRSYFINSDVYDQAYDKVELQVKDGTSVCGGIIPHHLFVADKLAAFFEGLKDRYNTVVIIGPDHFDKAKENIVLSRAEWQTPYGLVDPDLDLIDKLANDFMIDEAVFVNEHAITGLVPFIRKSLPRAKIVPIVIKIQSKDEDAILLAEKIEQYSKKNKTLVLASVDFSHYQPLSVANFHDLKSQSVINNFDYEKIFDLEIDSPASIYTVLKYLELTGCQNSKLLWSTNSSALLNKPDELGTSHNFFYFTSGQTTIKPAVNFLFFGDVMLDRYVKTLIEKNGVNYLLSDIAGGEDRFFQGIDIVSANLEGSVTNNGQHYLPEMENDFAFSPKDISEFKNYNFNFFNIANNHLTDQGHDGVVETRTNLDKLELSYSGCVDGGVKDCSQIVNIGDIKVAIMGLSSVYSKLDIEKVAGNIATLKDNNELVVVNIHWGKEYQRKYNDKQTEIARAMIDAGADIIIGHHPHVVQGVEIYKNKPIFYSLGNFIFDQYFSKETQEGLSVGIHAENDNYQIFLFPFKTVTSKAEPLSGSEKNRFLKELAELSDYGVYEQVSSGVIGLSADE